MSAPLALFRIAAGTRLGHGHLRRAEALASHMAARVTLSLRGTGAPTALDCVPSQPSAATLDALKPQLLVLDDPHPGHARRWCLAAQRRGIPVVSLHDLGLARVPSTLAIDGSITSPVRGWPAAAVLRGPAYAIIRPPSQRGGPVRKRASRVLVSLGGGPRLGLAMHLARELCRRHPALDVLVPSPERSRSGALAAVDRVHLLHVPHGLGAVLPEIDLALLGGGVSLYEAAAAGVPAIALPVVPAQRPTIRGLARAGVVREAGSLDGPRDAAWTRRVVDRVSQSLHDVAWRRDAARRGPQLIDGRGAARVAQAITELLERRARG